MIAPINILDPQQFVDHQDQEIIEVSTYASYLQGHIPGAKSLPWQATLNHESSYPGLPPINLHFEELLQAIGYQPHRHYVVYDDEGGGWAGRFIWLLHLIGHSELSYLDGGKMAWQHDGFELERTANSFTAHRQPVPQIKGNQLLRTEQIIASIASGATQFWDARSRAEYLGVVASAAKNGHIPGAVHCEWTQLMDPSKGLRIRQDSAEILARLGIDVQRPCITYCQSNHRSGFTYLVGQSMGMTIQPYPGGWAEWGNRDDTPVASAAKDDDNTANSKLKPQS